MAHPPAWSAHPLPPPFPLPPPRAPPALPFPTPRPQRQIGVRGLFGRAPSPAGGARRARAGGWGCAVGVPGTTRRAHLAPCPHPVWFSARLRARNLCVPKARIQTVPLRPPPLTAGRRQEAKSVEGRSGCRSHRPPLDKRLYQPPPGRQGQADAAKPHRWAGSGRDVLRAPQVQILERGPSTFDWPSRIENRCPEIWHCRGPGRAAWAFREEPPGQSAVCDPRKPA